MYLNLRAIERCLPRKFKNSKACSKHKSKSSAISPKTFSFQKKLCWSPSILSRLKWPFTIRLTKKYWRKSCLILRIRSGNFRKRFRKQLGWWTARFLSRIKSKGESFKKWTHCKIKWPSWGLSWKLLMRGESKRCKVMRWVSIIWLKKCYQRLKSSKSEFKACGKVMRIRTKSWRGKYPTKKWQYESVVRYFNKTYHFVSYIRGFVVVL